MICRSVQPPIVAPNVGERIPGQIDAAEGVEPETSTSSILRKRPEDHGHIHLGGLDGER